MFTFGNEMSLGVMARTHALARAIEATQPPGVRATVLGRSSVTVYFDALVTSGDELSALVSRLVDTGIEVRQLVGRHREIATAYGGKYGADLPRVAAYHGISEEEVVRIQTSSEYVVSALGAAPGLPQMMGLPPQLAMRRKPRPELTEVGSVLIASQSVVFPIRAPSGWWCIGRTPTRLFDPTSSDVTYLLPGDRVRFVPINEGEFATRARAERA